MTLPAILPNAASRIADQQGRTTQEWRDFFLRLSSQTDSVALSNALADLADRVTTLEDDETEFTIQGFGQIKVAGTPSAGLVQISLDDLEDSGVGAALLKITRNSQGLVEGTQSASTTDLAEGSNLYFTNERAQDAIAAAIAAGTQTGITITYDDALNKLSFTVAGGTGDVVGPASSVNNHVAFFDGATGKLLKDSGLTLSGTNTGDQTSIVGITGTLAEFNAALTGADFATGGGTATGTNTGDQNLSSYATTAAVAAGYQPLDGELTAIAGLASAADKVPYFTGSGTAALASFTAAARTFTAASTQAAQRTAIGVTSGGAIGASGQAYSRWDFVDHGVALSTNTGTSFLTNGSVPVVYQNTVATGALIAGEQQHPGICRIGTGSSVSGYSRMFFTPGLMLYLGGGEVWLPVCLRIPTLSTATQRFAVTFGLYNAITGPSRILDLTYSDNANGGLWQLRGIDGGGTTTANAATGPATNTFTQGLGLLINPAASSVSLIDAGVTVATITANIPSADPLGLALEINKSVGSTERTVDIDIAEYQNTFTTTR